MTAEIAKAPSTIVGSAFDVAFTIEERADMQC
jgi:hypothetical protein